MGSGPSESEALSLKGAWSQLLPPSWSMLPQIVLGSTYAQEEGLAVCSRHEFSAKSEKE